MGQTVYHPDQGLAAHTIVFTTKVAKGPRGEAGIPVFEQEYNLMLHAAGKVPFMPAVTDVGKNAVFYVMERGHGVIASRELYDVMTEEQQTTFAKDIALFIHRFAEAFREEDMQKFVAPNNRGSFLTMSQMTASLAHPVVREYLGDSLAGATAAAQEYGSKMVSSKENGVFHRDLNNGNILINENKLSKVLDYGNMQAGPLEESLASLYWNFPPAFTKTVCREFNTLSERKIEYRDVVLCQIASTLNFLRNNAEQGIKNDEGWLKEWLLESLDEIVVTKSAPHDPRKNPRRPLDPGARL